MSHRSPSQNPSASAPSAEDLNEKRREVLQSLSQGAQLTQEVLAENERLLGHLQELQDENARLRSAVEADDAIRKLVTTIEDLEREKQNLLSHKAAADERVHNVTDSIRDLERSLNDLANLYVAANSLHSTFSLRGTVRRLNEILEQLVGVQAHAIYLGSDAAPLHAIASRGLTDAEREQLVHVPAHVQDVAASGRAIVDEQKDASAGTLDNPAAVFPLVLEDNVVGVLAIVRSLSHKTHLTDIDFQMFRFLGQHATIAIMSAGLFATNSRKLPTTDAFSTLES